ncbi:hypothetical protein [Arcanobacterium canis]
MTHNNTHKFTKLGAVAAAVLTAMGTLGVCSTPESSTPAQDASPHADWFGACCWVAGDATGLLPSGIDGESTIGLPSMVMLALSTSG